MTAAPVARPVARDRMESPNETSQERQRRKSAILKIGVMIFNPHHRETIEKLAVDW
jgi:hypothetical protein